MATRPRLIRSPRFPLPGIPARSQILRRTFRKTVTLTQRRDGNVTTVTCTTNLQGTVFYYWYLDGIFVAVTTTNTFDFIIPAGEQARIECIPSHNANLDIIANAPSTPAARVVLWWIRSADTDVKEYKVEQQKDGGDWNTIATVPFLSGAWDYRITSPRLTDLADYTWRVTPVDDVSNEGTVTTLAARTIVRTPDAPEFTIAFDEGTTKVTFAEAA